MSAPWNTLLFLGKAQFPAIVSSAQSCATGLLKPTPVRHSGLNETSPTGAYIWMFNSQLVDCLGRIDYVWVVGGGMPLWVGLAVSKAHTVSVNSSEGKGFPNGDVIVLKGKVSRQSGAKVYQKITPHVQQTAHKSNWFLGEEHMRVAASAGVRSSKNWTGGRLLYRVSWGQNFSGLKFPEWCSD